jgi:hypothetical protein
MVGAGAMVVSGGGTSNFSKAVAATPLFCLLEVFAVEFDFATAAATLSFEILLATELTT